MNQDLGLKVLGEIMKWTDDRAGVEFAWLRLMARLKYDGYRDFQAGMRFIESLATWLQQFEPHERETAYAFVRQSLVYIGPSEMQRLVEQFFPRTVRDRLLCNNSDTQAHKTVRQRDAARETVPTAPSWRKTWRSGQPRIWPGRRLRAAKARGVSRYGWDVTSSAGCARRPDHERLVRMVAMEYGVQPHRVLIDRNARKASDRLRRQTLFMGLSDGARIDTIRHANSGLLGNEQFVQGTQVDTDKWKDLLKNLRDDLKDSDARFRLVYLVDDFAGTGTSFLRFDEEKAKWKGKLIRFRDSVRSANDGLGHDQLFEEGWVLGVHHYVASSAAAEAIKKRLECLAGADEFPKGWARETCPSFGMVLPADLPIDRDDGRHDDFRDLTRIYYDPIIRTKHTDVGGEKHLGLGYGRCALPLVLEHNTPNNSVALLWAETDGGDRDGDGVRAPAMRPLFRRRQRHE